MIDSRFKWLTGCNSLILYSIVFFAIGVICMKPTDISVLKEYGFANQKQYTYVDNAGDELEADSLVEIQGIGKILSYKDIYFATIPLLIVSCILGKVLFNSRDELRFIIYTNCIIGILLLWLITKPNIVSTIMYWCGIAIASFALRESASKKI